MIEKAKEQKVTQLRESEVFPYCNSEWRKDGGGRVWCTTKRQIREKMGFCENDMYTYSAEELSEAGQASPASSSTPLPRITDVPV